MSGGVKILRARFYESSEILQMNMAMSYWECYLPRFLLKEAIPCLWKPLKSVQISRTSRNTGNVEVELIIWLVALV